MNEKFPRIAAVILQFGNWQYTEACVESLLSSTYMPKWLIIVDNCSPDDSQRRITEWAAGKNSVRPQIIVLQLDENRGYAAGNNAGIAKAMQLGADAVLVVNNDTVLAPTALEALVSRLEAAQRPGLCGPLLVYEDDRISVQCCAGGFTNYLTGISKIYGHGLTVDEARRISAQEVEKAINYICGACVLVSRDFLETVGLMDEGYFLYCEEQDWALAAANRFDLSYAPDAIVYHREGASTGWNRNKLSLGRAMRLARSRIRLAWRYHPWFMPIVGICSFWAMCKKYMGKFAVGVDRTKKQ